MQDLMVRPAQPMLDKALAQWGGRRDLWLFGYASLIWRPDFEFLERRAARAFGWHRALQMWSRVNRGSPQQPGLVFALLSGGSCQGMVFRVAAAQGKAVLHKLWDREMVTGVYDPAWLRCHTTQGKRQTVVPALAFTLSRRSPNYTGELSSTQLRHIFATAQGRYGSTADYATQTYQCLQEHGIEDQRLAQCLRDAGMPLPALPILKR